ncbi:hypothetical protein [Afipia carboxidovorans]|uniref:hypothetical protein n=1 Tax=Afipia carboxidovorans TaxID=40137 RepID=UPI0030CE3381
MASAAGSYNLVGAAITFGGSFKAQPGSYGLNGHAVALPASLSADRGQYSITGNEAALRTLQPASSGAYSITGAAAALRSRFDAETGSYSVTGTGTLAPVVMIADAGRYVLTLGDFKLIRTGDDTEQVYGGVGHYLEELRRLERLNAITRRRPPALFREARPAIRRSIAPGRQAPGPSALPTPAIHELALKRAALLKKQRDEEAILLLLAS